jgi:hypothetical protein
MLVAPGYELNLQLTISKDTAQEKIMFFYKEHHL